METDDLYAKIAEFERATKEANAISDKYDADIRDTGKKVQKFETKLEETVEKLQASQSKMDEAEAEFKDKDEDVNAQSRRVLLLEEECAVWDEEEAAGRDEGGEQVVEEDPLHLEYALHHVGPNFRKTILSYFLLTVFFHLEYGLQYVCLI